MSATDPGEPGIDDITRAVVGDFVKRYRGIALAACVLLVLVVAAPTRSPEPAGFNADFDLQGPGIGGLSLTTPAPPSSVPSTSPALAPLASPPDGLSADLPPTSLAPQARFAEMVPTTTTTLNELSTTTTSTTTLTKATTTTTTSTTTTTTTAPRPMTPVCSLLTLLGAGCQ
jgi:hypothetical protein